MYMDIVIRFQKNHLFHCGRGPNGEGLGEQCIRFPDLEMICYIYLYNIFWKIWLVTVPASQEKWVMVMHEFVRVKTAVFAKHFEINNAVRKKTLVFWWLFLFLIFRVSLIKSVFSRFNIYCCCFLFSHMTFGNRVKQKWFLVTYILGGINWMDPKD